LVDKTFEELVYDNLLKKLAIYSGQMPSDLISNTRKHQQEKFTMLASHPIELRRINVKNF
jgi:hypothetical protein